MVVRHNCYVINPMRMRISFLEGEKEREMPCEISHLGYFRAVCARAVGVRLDLGKCRWETENGKSAICATQGYQQCLSGA